MKKILLSLLFACIISFSLFGITADDLINKLDENEGYKTLKSKGEMIINITGKKYIKTFNSFTKEKKDYFMEFTNPDDLGTKYLRKNGNLFVYSEDTEEIIPITGHMLKESIMGSDLSYEDAVNNDTLSSQYNGKILSKVVFQSDTKYKNNDVWILELTAKKKTAPYAKRIVWVDNKTFLALKTEYYSLSGKKMKEEVLLNDLLINNRYIPIETQMTDLQRKNSFTLLKISDIEMNINIPDTIFSFANLQK